MWGFATVVASRCAGVAVGTQVYGYLPMSSHVVLHPCAERVNAQGFSVDREGNTNHAFTQCNGHASASPVALAQCNGHTSASPVALAQCSHDHAFTQCNGHASASPSPVALAQCSYDHACDHITPTCEVAQLPAKQRLVLVAALATASKPVAALAAAASAPVCPFSSIQRCHRAYRCTCVVCVTPTVAPLPYV